MADITETAAPKLPDFFIIGAAKAGTTSLYAILNRHPQVFMPEIKEPEFFARDELYAQGIDSYAAAFAAAGPDQLVGEASTLYSLSPLFPATAGRIHRHVPDARLIYVLREPVSRAYSYYVQIIKNYQNVTRDYAVHRSFEEFVLPEAWEGAAPRDRVFSAANAHLPDAPELCLAGSDYLAQIGAYLEHFDRAQMLFLRFEDFVADPAAAVDRITGFLGLDPLDPGVLAEPGTRRNVASDHFANVGRARSVGRIRGALGPLWGLRRALPRGIRRRLLPGLAGAGAPDDAAHEPPKMLPETRAMLTARYAPDRARLAELTGLDLDSWA